MSILDRLKHFLRPKASPPASSDHDCVSIQWTFSELGKQRGASPHPILCVGHGAPLGVTIAQQSTLSTIQVDDPDKLPHVCTCPSFVSIGMQFVGIIAHSRPQYPGEAARAISLFRAHNRTRGAAIYCAWDYNVSRASAHAVACSADGVLMPGIDTNEMFSYIFGVLERVQGGAEPPPSSESHIALLHTYTTDRSPFWASQNLVHSPYH